MSRPRIIKVSLKSDISIIWFDIWDAQSDSRAKGLINRCFNMGNYITTIQDANMNPEVSQCKNCWKWRYVTSVCRIQEAKCIKCNGPHELEHHRQFACYYKTNEKTNPPRLETKKRKPCPHSFKCSNCKEDHQSDLNLCPFWQHQFNRKWHSKKYQKLCESRRQSICSTVNGNESWLLKTLKFFHRTCEKTTWLSTQSLKLNILLMSSLFKNCHGLLFAQYQVQKVKMKKHW